MKGPNGRARHIRSWLVAACCIAGFALPAESSGQATTSELAGVVVTESGDPIADVSLSIGRSDLATRSDMAGRFIFPSAPWGQVRLHARAVGYGPVDTLMLLQSGTTYSIRLQLKQLVLQLDTVQVRAPLAYGKPARYQHTGKFDDFYERRARRPGMFFTREEIERSPANKVTELISSGAGIQLSFRFTTRGWEPNLRVARCTAVGGTTRVPPDKVLAVYLNGQRVTLGVLEELATSEIETLEVYRGPSQLPVEAMGDACAAVFITTRYTPGSVLTGNR